MKKNWNRNFVNNMLNILNFIFFFLVIQLAHLNSYLTMQSLQNLCPQVVCTTGSRSNK